MKKIFFQRSEKSGIVYIFANISDIWLNRRRLNFPICLCIQSLQNEVSCSLWKTLLHTCEKKEATASQFYYENNFDLMDPPERALAVLVNWVSKKKKERKKQSLEQDWFVKVSLSTVCQFQATNLTPLVLELGRDVQPVQAAYCFHVALWGPLAECLRKDSGKPTRLPPRV